MQFFLPTVLNKVLLFFRALAESYSHSWINLSESWQNWHFRYLYVLTWPISVSQAKLSTRRQGIATFFLTMYPHWIENWEIIHLLQFSLDKLWRNHQLQCSSLSNSVPGELQDPPSAVTHTLLTHRGNTGSIVHRHYSFIAISVRLPSLAMLNIFHSAVTCEGLWEYSRLAEMRRLTMPSEHPQSRRTQRFLQG